MRLTYLELLEAVKKGKQPKKIKVGGIVYSWDGSEYVQNTDSRQTLSDRLPNWTTKAQTTADFIEEAVDILTGEEKEVLKTLWIPITERLPDYYERVLVFTRFDGVHVGYRGMIGDKDYYFLGGIDKRVGLGTIRAWMSIPQPYEEREE